MVSGTASIDGKGRSVHPNDVRAQVEHTMGVLKEILKSYGKSWNDVTRAVAYFRKRGDFRVLREYLKKRRIFNFPLIITEGTICRKELLFDYGAWFD